MLKKIVIILAATVFLVAAAAEVSAQDVLMNSAETINQGNYQAGPFPDRAFRQERRRLRMGCGRTGRIRAHAALRHRGQGRDLQRPQLLRSRSRVLARPRAECQRLGGAGRTPDGLAGRERTAPASTPRSCSAPGPRSVWSFTGASSSPSIRSRTRIRTSPGCISCRGSSTASAPTSISWPSSVSPSTTTPAAMSALDWRYTFCADGSGLANRGAWGKELEGTHAITLLFKPGRSNP